MSTEQQPEPNNNHTLFDELAVLGKNIGAAVRSVIESPQAREIEEEVRTGFQTVVHEVNEAIDKARTTDVARDLGEKTSQAAESVRSSKVTEEVRFGLVKGLKSLNRELEQMLQHLETPSAPDAPTAAAPSAAPSPSPEPVADEPEATE